MATVAVSKEKIWTDAQLEALPRDGYKRELLDGRIIMSPVHASHGIICVRLSSMLFQHVERHSLGEILDSSTGFRLSEKLLLSPDISFVSKSTLKRIMVRPDKFLCGAPDLAVEVLSPSDRMREVYRKLDLYFEHGTRMAWLVDWKKRQVQCYTTDEIQALTQPHDVLSGGLVVPGFKCRLARLFQT